MTDDNSMSCPAHATPLTFAQLITDPHAATAEHRAASWFTTMPDTGAACVPLTHDAARHLLSNDRLAPNLQGRLARLMSLNQDIAPEHLRLASNRPPSFLDLHGDAHRTVRALFSRAFAPRMINRVVPAMDSLATDLASKLEPGCDFMAAFARPFPGEVLCEVLGIPHEDRHGFTGWVDHIGSSLSPARLLSMTTDESLAVLDAERRLAAYSADLVAERRRAPGDDLISAIVTDPECNVDDDALAAHLGSLLFAGTDTTRSMLGMLVSVLAQHPDEWERLRQHPDRADIVLEELLRWQGAASGAARTVVADFDYQGRRFTADESVVIALWAANRDPAVYEEPDRFLPDRWLSGPPGHVAFGHGAHFCLGASLARQELRTAAVALTEQLPCPRVVECEMRPPVGIVGPTRLVIDFDPA